MTSAAPGLPKVVFSRCCIRGRHHNDARRHAGRMRSSVNGSGPSRGNRGATAPGTACGRISRRRPSCPAARLHFALTEAAISRIVRWPSTCCTKGNWAELRRTRQSGRKISVSESIARSTGAEARSGEEIGRATMDFTARSDITTGHSRSMRPQTTCSPSGIFFGSRQKASLTNRLNRSGGSKLARGSALTVRLTVCSPGVPARSSNSVTS